MPSTHGGASIRGNDLMLESTVQGWLLPWIRTHSRSGLAFSRLIICSEQELPAWPGVIAPSCRVMARYWKDPPPIRQHPLEGEPIALSDHNSMLEQSEG